MHPKEFYKNYQADNVLDKLDFKLIEVFKLRHGLNHAEQFISRRRPIAVFPVRFKLVLTFNKKIFEVKSQFLIFLYFS